MRRCMSCTSCRTPAPAPAAAGRNALDRFRPTRRLSPGKRVLLLRRGARRQPRGNEASFPFLCCARRKLSPDDAFARVAEKPYRSAQAPRSVMSKLNRRTTGGLEKNNGHPKTKREHPDGSIALELRRQSIVRFPFFVILQSSAELD